MVLRQECSEQPRGILIEIGGEAGIRTLGTALRPYNGLANRRLQPLGHLTAARKLSINEIATYALADCPHRLSLKLSLPALKIGAERRRCKRPER